MRKFRKHLPDQKVLKQLFKYDDGKLLYNDISYPPHKRLIGKQADFANHQGYRIVNIRTERIQVMAHRVIWKMFYGTEPKYLDHIDNDKSNNRIENLQICTNSLNMLKSNVGKGVSYFKRDNKWRARIKINKKEIHLGLFDTKEEARAARTKAENEYLKDLQC